VCNFKIKKRVYDTNLMEVAKVNFFAGNTGNNFHPRLLIAGRPGEYSVSQIN
jgi:hypothetical protein